MIHIDYQYRKKDGTIHTATNYFYDVNSAVRFVYVINRSNDKRLISFGADNSEESYLLNRKLGL